MLSECLSLFIVETFFRPSENFWIVLIGLQELAGQESYLALIERVAQLPTIGCRHD